MFAFYMSLKKPAGSHTENTFRIRRSRNHNVTMNLNGNKLANVQRDIMNKKRLTDFELREIKEKVITDLKDIDSGNVRIRDGDVDYRNECTGGVSCTDADTTVARARYVDQREYVNHIGALDDIPIDEGSEDEFELVGEGNHNVSYDTTGNNTIMSHPSVNENSKTNSNHKKRKSDRTGEENNDVEYTSFRNEIIETIKKKNEAINMSERENLTKVKIKKSQEKYLNFANLAIQEICDDIELDMNDTNTMLYTCANTQVKTHWERRFDKRNKFYRQNKIF